MNESVISKQPAGRPQTADRTPGSAGRILTRTVMWIFLLVTAVLTLFPLLMTLTGSLKTGAEMMTGEPCFLPSCNLITMPKPGSRPISPAIPGTVLL